MNDAEKLIQAFRKFLDEVRDAVGPDAEFYGFKEKLEAAEAAIIAAETSMEK